MSDVGDRLSQLETLLNTQRTLEAALDTIDDSLAANPPRTIRLRLVARRNRVVAELDDVREQINALVARRAAIHPPDPELVQEVGETADRVEEAANHAQAAEGALALANDALETAKKVRDSTGGGTADG